MSSRIPSTVLLLVAVLAACAPASPPPPSPVALPGARALDAAPTSTALPPVAGTTVVIDPGHNGGNDGDPDRIAAPVPDGRGGTKPCNTTGSATADGYPEHAFAWEVSRRLADALRGRGVRVVLTRDSDDGVGPCVDERGASGGRAGADAVISVHADGADAGARGFHVLHPSPPLNAAQGAPSRSLADGVVAAMRRGGFAPADYVGSGGLDPRDDIAGLNLSTVPAVLVECANLRNAADAATARSPQGHQRYADALADAVSTWLAGPRR